MKIRHSRPGFSMLEVMLFIGIVGIISGTFVSVFIATEEARIRQRSVAQVEQRGTQLLETLTKTIRRSETIIAPAAGSTGSILALQMALNGEYPTIIAKTASGNMLEVQKTTIGILLDDTTIAKNLTFKNLNNTNVIFSFDLETKIPLVHPIMFTRHFESTVTLFPDDQSEGGGCGTCPVPTCVSHVYHWYQCLSDVCSQANETIAC